MATNPCKICGSTDLNLVDGFYYCVECGTQDVNARETVVEQTLLADGTFAHTTIKKYKTVLEDSIEMSGEWHKWHAYNFILSGLTDELIALGAAPSVKTVVMWIWVRYIKKFQVKEDKENNNNLDDDSISESKKHCDNSSIISNDLSTDTFKKDTEKFKRYINIVTKGTLLTILYVALNLDRSDIQLSHIFRYIREGRLSLYSCIKYVPKELNTKSIPHWMSFVRCQNEYTPKVIRAMAMTFFKCLNLGVPLVPDLNKIITNYIKELCLPKDFKQLVLSLMHLIPCDHLVLKSCTGKKIVRVPDYEGACMAYVLVALKLCFGCDDDYEVKLSDEVDRINCEENHLKSYKLGMYSDPSERLLSFREWCTYLQFRKTILCKYYLPLARQMHMPIDDAVLMDHLEKRMKRKPKLRDEVTMDILNKIMLNDDKVAIPKTEFPANLTPMTSYTDVIIEYIQDPDFKLLLCEDFSQYSLKYAIIDLKLPTNDLTKMRGVSKNGKVINPYIVGTLQAKKGDNTMVFIRNCENKNWLKTKPPSIEHVMKLTNKSSEDSDSCDSVIDITETEIDLDGPMNEKPEKEIEFETIDIEEWDKSIFDDDFLDLEEKDNKNDTKSESDENIFEFINNDHDIGDREIQDSKIDLQDSVNAEDAYESLDDYNPETFDRNKAIKELIDMACKKYKIPKPREKQTQPRTQKRKNNLINDETGVSEPKRVRIIDKQARIEARTATKELLAAYYKNIEEDILQQVSEHVKTVIQNTDIVNEAINEANYEPLEEQTDENVEENSIEKDCNESMISSIHPNITTVDTLNDEDCVYDEIDPNFDEKTHDIKQLYVKFNKQDINVSDHLLDIENDIDIEKIIEKKIDEFQNCNTINDNIEDIDTNNEKQVEKQTNELIITEKKIYTDPLIERDIRKFRYWLRHYKTITFARCLDMNYKFDLELLENCPKSFIFVIKECAAILDCTTFCLYKCMQNLEVSLMALNK
ncbi:unnamed protein product [Danaus chrysippus]|uniref:TATA box-binding protein-associated factor RNA polymerase I subunit B n=1 Tax=Danaus chrysippus TaxID=151541 RepID=A0A8J2W6D2_9NEOP|nr:unnamed protein product [Danaus chrysippus]